MAAKDYTLTFGADFSAADKEANAFGYRMKKLNDNEAVIKLDLDDSRLKDLDKRLNMVNK